MLVTADLDNEIAMKTGEKIWKEMPFQLCLSPAVISYLFYRIYLHLDLSSFPSTTFCLYVCVTLPV